MQSVDEMLFLLMVIKRGADISPFLVEHLGFAGIGRMCVEALEAGLIISSGSSYQITEKGLQFISEQNDLLGRKGLDREIAKIPDALCPKISINSIYLPDRF